MKYKLIGAILAFFILLAGNNIVYKAILELDKGEYIIEKTSVDEIKITYEFIEPIKVRDFPKYRTKPRLNSRGSTHRINEAPNEEFTAVVTGYCSCNKCCGKGDGITAAGTRARWGVCAAPQRFPFGTKLEIEGLGTFVVEDRGGAIKGNRIDIWFPSHEKALEFGVKIKRVKTLKIQP